MKPRSSFTPLSQVLFCVDAELSQCLRQKKLYCAVSEERLKKWPESHVAAHVSRLDNINHCLRSFGVDGGSTRAMQTSARAKPSGEHLFRSNFEEFLVLYERAEEDELGAWEVHLSPTKRVK